LYTGPFDPQRLTGGAQGHVGWPPWPSQLGVAQPDRLPGTSATGHGGGYDTGRGGGRGAAGPGAHREPAGGVGLARGWTAAMNLAAEEVGFRRGIRDADDDSGRVAPIPSTGRQRTARRTFSARQGSSGQRLIVALGGDLRLL
jgi:hypothetical protein